VFYAGQFLKGHLRAETLTAWPFGPDTNFEVL
jgi:hypothetical protein